MLYIVNLPTSNNTNTNSLGTDSNSPSTGAYSVSKASQQISTENVHFVDGDTPWSYDISSSPDSTTQLAGFSDAQLGSFLGRPIKIKEFQWVPRSARLFETFNPWTEFFTNSDVLEKINRYRNLRCNLRMKMLINGNSFYYGRALVSYNPYLIKDDVTLVRGFFEQDIVGASQKPHFLLDPTTSQGGEMLLPFLWPENFLDITQPNWHANMGRVTIHDFDILRHANGGTDPITVTVFVWAEDVVLSVPTTTQVQSGSADRVLDEFGFPTYEEQASGRKKMGPMKKVNNTRSNDEFVKDGLISKPASAVANAANALSMIPVISPYAKATAMVATRIGQIAKIFGYSRPQVLEDTKPYVPRYMGNLSNSDTPETLVKLSLDSKNELTIDTRVMGLGGEDELAISAIAQRPSFWQQFDWTEAATTDTLLASMLVTPALVRTLSASPVNEVHPTALAFASSPFSAWQGSIKFRFNVVCSEYHRGRLRIVYNPRTNNSGAVPYNQVYSTTIDISEDRDFEYEVKWADIRAWNVVLGADAAPSYLTFNTAGTVAAGNSLDNGSLSVYVVNELATPSNVDASVKIQVWVSGGDDIAFAVPSVDGLKNISYFQEQSEIAPFVPQADEAPVLATSMDESNAPDCSNPLETFGSGADMIKADNQYLVYQGERIMSFREMLRRYHYHASYWPGDQGTGTRMVAMDLSDFPYYRGWDPNGPDNGTSSILLPRPYSFCNMTLLNYLTPAFVMRRGALRHKAILIDKNVGGHSSSFGVARHNFLGTANGMTSHPLNGALVGNRRSRMLETLRGSLGGTALTPAFNNPCLEYETPFYTAGQRFVSARDLDYYAGINPSHELTTEIKDTDSELDIRVDKYISTAEDFQLGLFIGAPVYYVYNNPVAV